MKITETEVRYVADLANLKLTDQEIARLSKDLDEILTHIDTLSELDTSNVQPMAQVLYEADETATLREDRERPPLSRPQRMPPMTSPPVRRHPGRSRWHRRRWRCRCSN